MSDPKPLITLTDAASTDMIRLTVQDGPTYTVKNDPTTVADKIHEINHGK